VNCTKMCLAIGLRLDPLGSYSAPPDPLAVIRGTGWKGIGRKWLGVGKEVREGSKEVRERVGRDGKGVGRE